jgi:hypothetical protein
MISHIKTSFIGKVTIEEEELLGGYPFWR